MAAVPNSEHHCNGHCCQKRSYCRNHSLSCQTITVWTGKPTPKWSTFKIWLLDSIQLYISREVGRAQLPTKCEEITNHGLFRAWTSTQPGEETGCQQRLKLPRTWNTQRRENLTLTLEHAAPGIGKPKETANYRLPGNQENQGWVTECRVLLTETRVLKARRGDDCTTHWIY